ncbi:MAG: LysR substrate-binding domain-containing protein [Burkholderiaceae bacterium]
MEFRHLRYFVAVAEERHFSKAAERLHISQPPLSQQIQVLEARLGFSLFDRRFRKVTLTEAGEALLVRARVILESVDQAVSEAKRLASGEQGHLAIGFMSAAMLPLVSPYLRSFHQQYPGVEIELRQMTSAEQTLAVASGALDVALLDIPARWGPLNVDKSELQLRTLREDFWAIAVDREHRLAGRKRLPLRELEGETLITLSRFPERGYYDQVLEMCGKAGYVPTKVREVAQIPVVLSLVATGAGVALAPACCLTGWEQQLVFVRCAEPGSIEISVAWRADNQSRVLEAFIRVLKQNGCAI